MAARLLVIDDDESLLEICETGLRLAGYQVATAASGEEGVKKIDAESFDLVITDMKMPGRIDGVGVVRHVKATHPITDVIVVTGTPTLQTAIATLKDGAYDYIIKPFVVDHLKAVVQRCLDHRRLREDLTSERAMRQELRTAYEELQKVEQLKESIMARVSHELKTPLSEMIMALHLMEELGKAPAKDPSGDKGQKYMELAKLAYARLERTLSNLMVFSEFSRPTALKAPAAVDMAALCLRLIEGLRPLWEPRDLKVSAEFEPGFPPALGEAPLLEKALEHILHNAVLFNRQGGSIRVAGRKSGERVEIAVSDTGEGIPESEFNQIFDSFYQVANYLTRKVDGLGLGLAISRRILEAHGGSISVSSKLGEGTSFVLILPAFPGVKKPER